MACVIQVILTWNHNIWVFCNLDYAYYVKSELLIMWEINVFHYYILLSHISKILLVWIREWRTDQDFILWGKLRESIENQTTFCGMETTFPGSH